MHELHVKEHVEHATGPPRPFGFTVRLAGQDVCEKSHGSGAHWYLQGSLWVLAHPGFEWCSVCPWQSSLMFLGWKTNRTNNKLTIKTRWTFEQQETIKTCLLAGSCGSSFVAAICPHRARFLQHYSKRSRAGNATLQFPEVFHTAQRRNRSDEIHCNQHGFATFFVIVWWAVLLITHHKFINHLTEAVCRLFFLSMANQRWTRPTMCLPLWMKSRTSKPWAWYLEHVKFLHAIMESYNPHHVFSFAIVCLQYVQRNSDTSSMPHGRQDTQRAFLGQKMTRLPHTYYYINTNLVKIMNMLNGVLAPSNQVPRPHHATCTDIAHTCKSDIKLCYQNSNVSNHFVISNYQL